jgi:hypothetical protein
MVPGERGTIDTDPFPNERDPKCPAYTSFYTDQKANIETRSKMFASIPVITKKQLVVILATQSSLPTPRDLFFSSERPGIFPNPRRQFLSACRDS